MAVTEQRLDGSHSTFLPVHIGLGNNAGLTDDEVARASSESGTSRLIRFDVVLIRAVSELDYNAFISDEKMA